MFYITFQFLEDGWVLPETMTISMEFRTTKQNGILLTSGGDQSTSFTLELHNGQVRTSNLILVFPQQMIQLELFSAF